MPHRGHRGNFQFTKFMEMDSVGPFRWPEWVIWQFRAE